MACQDNKDLDLFSHTVHRDNLFIVVLSETKQVLVIVAAMLIKELVYVFGCAYV